MSPNKGRRMCRLTETLASIAVNQRELQVMQTEITDVLMCVQHWKARDHAKCALLNKGALEMHSEAAPTLCDRELPPQLVSSKKSCSISPTGSYIDKF